MAFKEPQTFASTQTSTPLALDSESLPSSKSEDIKLEPAELLEYVQTAYLNSAEWKGPLTMDQYLEREDALQAVELTKDGRITGWILTPTSTARNADGSRPILASCESMPVHAYVARDGVLEKIQAHGIASVYNRPEYRGRGYASRMMADLSKRLETWQAVNGVENKFSVLFSDIGQTFYARFGWKIFASTHIHLHPLTRAAHEEASSGLPSVEDLSLKDLKNIPMTDYLEHRLRETSKTKPNTPRVAIRPAFENFEWHFVRDEVQTKILGKNFPSVKGAIHRETGIALIWCRVYATKQSDWQLHILHAVVPPPVESTTEAQDVMAALLLRAQLEAHVWGMEAGVEVWDPTDFVIASAQRLRSKEQGKVEIITRDKEHLCSLRWAGNTDDDVVWLAKEKYVWC